MMRALLALAFVATVSASGCPNKCSGHGSCILGDKCSCQPLWVGNDCGSRQCAYGLSWITAAATENAPAGALSSSTSMTHEGLGGRHLYAECSDKGSCDRSTGECECYAGYEGKGCRRHKCPNDCSGHGRCVYNRDINPNYFPQGYDANNAGADVSPNHYIEFGSEYWDYNKARACVCDRGFEGTDCSSRICPKGDDPLTDCDGAAHTADVQSLAFGANYFDMELTSTATLGGFFSLKFTDMYGANYTTRPIELPQRTMEMTATAGDASAAINGADYKYIQMYADDIEEALESLPNFAIPNVTVTTEWATPTDAQQIGVYVTFVDSANAGVQNLLECSYASKQSSAPTDIAAMGAKNIYSPYNYGAAQPRFVSPHLEDADRVGGGSGSSRVCVASHHNTATMEHVECSNRGDCDASTGLCECYEGFTGEACSTQTVFF